MEHAILVYLALALVAYPFLFLKWQPCITSARCNVPPSDIMV